jgi:hypothetical protein
MRDFESDRDNSIASCGCRNLKRPIEMPVITVGVYDNRLSQQTVTPDAQHQKPLVKQYVCPLLYRLPYLRTSVIVPLSIKEMCRYIMNGLLLHLFY